MKRSAISAGVLLSVVLAPACVNLGDLDGSFVLPDPSLSYPDPVLHDGDAIQLGDVDESWSGLQPYELRNYRIGPPDYLGAEEGGITILLKGTGYPLCVTVDPEATATDSCDYNDGDLDLFVGKLSDYTALNPNDPEGEPLTGTAVIDQKVIGSFEGEWVDDIGVTHTSDTNLCNLSSDPTTPLWRSMPESCAFETTEGEDYVVVLRTFAMPVDDYVLNAALLVQPGHRGEAGCVFNSKNYIVATAEDLDESDAAYGDQADTYAANRNPCLCPKDEDERAACGLVDE